MADEYKALIDNGTWCLVPRPPSANVVTGKWIFKHKFHSDGSLARHKASWVVHGFSQCHDIKSSLPQYASSSALLLHVPSRSTNLT
jgi:hypothetical protein